MIVTWIYNSLVVRFKTRIKPFEVNRQRRMMNIYLEDPNTFIYPKLIT